MKLISLVENHSCRPDCGCVHGLSLYLETPTRHILFDMGPNALFLENAQALGVDITCVDLAFLSHGHHDHGGGLELFCKRNNTAPVFIGPAAFLKHAVKNAEGYEDIGLPTTLSERLAGRLLDHEGRLSDDLYVLREVPGHDCLGSASASLLEETETGFVPDPFSHEQSLILSCEGKHFLLAGCAHRGIVNILCAGEAVIGGEFDCVISGFHLTNPSLGIDEPEALVRAVGEALALRKHTRYFSGHCTGDGPFALLKTILGDRLSPIPAGSVLLL